MSGISHCNCSPDFVGRAQSRWRWRDGGGNVCSSNSLRIECGGYLRSTCQACHQEANSTCQAGMYCSLPGCAADEARCRCKRCNTDDGQYVSLNLKRLKCWSGRDCRSTSASYHCMRKYQLAIPT